MYDLVRGPLRALRGLVAVVALMGLGLTMPGGALAQDDAGQIDPKLVERGHQVYKSVAQCQFCHGWHGAGDDSEYGGAAPSLRATGLDKADIMLTVRCGRPDTNMPFHDKNAYGKTDCYGISKDDPGVTLPPRAIKFLSDRDIEAVADYVVAVLKGKPQQPTHAECVAFWGSETRACDKYQ